MKAIEAHEALELIKQYVLDDLLDPEGVEIEVAVVVRFPEERDPHTMLLPDPVLPWSRLAKEITGIPHPGPGTSNMPVI